ncbi:hypothetical protein SAMN05443247_08134 [Bradyrhizobium erythrophlei]|jgi:phosphoribosylanthranilate isomerase|nr:hypothetical protein SAMN05443247_08134 [Bradyrhizobium erythrophlei]
MLTQIYEISSPDEARGVSEIGIDHVGFWWATASFRANSGFPGRRRLRRR